MSGGLSIKSGDERRETIKKDTDRPRLIDDLAEGNDFEGLGDEPSFFEDL